MAEVQVKVWFESWAGRTSLRAVLVKETKLNYKVRWLETGLSKIKDTESYVPKAAVTFLEDK